MPNVGRPSKGCKNCRDRKVKCDQKRPSCSQCVRAGQECHGYRDMLSMMFKNESDVVARKAERRYASLAKQKVPKHTQKTDEQNLDHDGREWVAFAQDFHSADRSETRVVPCARYPTPESLSLEIVPSIEDQAQGFFIANYVSNPSIVPRGEFDWVTDLLSRPDAEQSVRRSFNAASLAGLANASKNPAILQKAQKAYVEALRITNSALRDKETAVMDSTLISVIMLGMYENMVFQGKEPMQAWAKHVAGACALFQLRGKKQFQSNIARRLFHQFYGTVLLVALESGLALHSGMHELYEACHPTSSDYEIHGRQWTTTVVTIMHRALNLDHGEQKDPVVLLSTAMKIDQDLNKIKALMPSVWQFKVVSLEQASEYQYGNFYHVYLDPWIAQMWNNLRSCQMFLYKNMQVYLAKGCEEYSPPLFSADTIKPQMEAAERVMRATIAAIIASVPQITGMVPFPKVSASKGSQSCQSSPTKQLSTHQMHPPGTFLDASRCPRMIHLIWPLYTVGLSEYSNFEMRQWCIQILHFIALRIGTRQAVVLAEHLKEIQIRAGLLENKGFSFIKGHGNGSVCTDMEIIKQVDLGRFRVSVGGPKLVSHKGACYGEAVTVVKGLGKDGKVVRARWDLA